MLLLIGSPLVLLIWSLLQKSLKSKIIVLLAIVAATLLLVVLLDGRWTVRGLPHGGQWWNSSPWKEIILLVALIAGTMLRVVSDSIERYRVARKSTGRSRPKRPSFDSWEFLYSAICSLLVFQSVLSFSDKQDLSWELVLFSLENGFFWNHVLDKFKTTRALEAKA